MRTTSSRLCRAVALASLALLMLPGCLQNVQVDKESRHREISWVSDFERARCLAARKKKPILVVMVGGELEDRC